jgi:hypothetical protein
MLELLAPIRILRNIHKGYQFSLVESYESKFGETFP